MDLDWLYREVTKAIHQAEMFEDMRAPAMRDAYSYVSTLEERIAALLPSSDREGAVARRGAVRAALKAQEFQRAKDLAVRFALEGKADSSLLEDLRRLRGRAVAMAARQRRAAAGPDGRTPRRAAGS